MLTPKENFLETIRGGNPDRFVNQYSFMHMMRSPYFRLTTPVQKGGDPVINQWGVTIAFPDYVPGPFPVHNEKTLVVKDIAEWKSYVKAPRNQYSEAEWEPWIAEAEATDRKEQLVFSAVFPGIFEQMHYLCGMEETMMAFYEEPEAIRDLIKYITEWEIGLAEEYCSHIHPDGVFHHDDWGSQISTFFSPEMFEEFFVPAYRQIYGCYKEHGAEIVIHHSDSYAETLIPQMIQMGINVWQGALTTNHIPDILKKYGDQISIMGGIDCGKVDVADWTEDSVYRIVRDICEKCGPKNHFLPCVSQGGPGSAYPGVYEAVSRAIDRCSEEMF